MEEITRRDRANRYERIIKELDHAAEPVGQAAPRGDKHKQVGPDWRIWRR